MSLPLLVFAALIVVYCGAVYALALRAFARVFLRNTSRTTPSPGPTSGSARGRQ